MQNDLADLIHQKHLSQIRQDVTKLQNLCTNVETDFMSTKNDVGNLQVNKSFTTKI